jgi:hypothetical protein
LRDDGGIEHHPRDECPERRMASPSLARIAVAVCLFLALAPFPGEASVSAPERARYEAAVAHCRSKPKQLSLNEEKSIFCFDGEVRQEQHASSLELLNSEGLFVVRSPGGSGIAAARIATLLEEKKVIVVIYDYCLSACASFFFVAGARTYVLKDTIVAWHYGWRAWLPCEDVGYGIEYRNSDGARRLSNGRVCYEYTEKDREVQKALRSIATPFFARRIVDLQRFNLDRPPRSAHIAMILRSKARDTGTSPEVFWTWNPRYHKSTLRTDVFYEKYPESQDDVDALMQRFLGKHVKSNSVLHDP